ncbi:MAG TPA: hypothetical protein VGK94_11820 [Candidatus Polarisedimenticolia bacterium]|jgi:predicted Zn-dependent peptidase
MPVSPISGLFSSLLMASASVAASPATARQVLLHSNEVNVLEAPDPQVQEVRFRLVLYSGSAADPPGREGLAWLAAASIQIQAGPGVHAQVDKDVTLFTGRAPRNGGAELFGSLSKALLRPLFDERELARLRIEQKRALETLRGDSVALLREAFDWFVYRGHPYEHPAPGLDSSIDRITREEILAFHAEQYRKGNLAIGVYGAVDPDLIARIREDLANLPDGTPGPSAGAVALLARPRALIVEMEGAPRSLVLAGHPLNVTPAHPDYPSVAAAMLRLKAVQEGARPRRQQSLAIPVDAEPADAAGAIRRVMADLATLVSGGIDGPALVELKREMGRTYGAAAQGPEGALVSRLDDLLLRSPRSAQRLPASIEESTVESVRSALARHLFPQRVAVVVITTGAEDLARRLSSGPEDPAGSAVEGRFRRNEIEIVRARDLFR